MINGYTKQNSFCKPGKKITNDVIIITGKGERGKEPKPTTDTDILPQWGK
jgi:hypothetical protein